MSALKDRRILVTRPAGLERTLMQLIRDDGGKPEHLAVIEITPPDDEQSRVFARDHFRDFDMAIFISPTAVKQTLAFMDIDDKQCTLVAIGSRSQQALHQAGLRVGVEPRGHDSESLLAQEEMQQDRVQGKSIIIFRGEDGRDVLADELTQRGAQVHYAAMYTRKRPQTTVTSDMLDSLDAITISSNEGLQNLYDIIKDCDAGTDKLLQIPLFVPGQRASTLATQLGFKHIVQADNATDQAMHKALVSQLHARV